MVVQVYLGRQDLTGLMERPVTAVRQDRSDQLVNQEHQAALDQQDPVETQAHQDQWERAAFQVGSICIINRLFAVSAQILTFVTVIINLYFEQDHRDRLANEVRLESEEKPDLQDQRGPLDHQDHLVHVVSLVQRDPLGRGEILVRADKRDPQDHEVTPDRQDPPVCQENQVSVTNFDSTSTTTCTFHFDRQLYLVTPTKSKH